MLKIRPLKFHDYEQISRLLANEKQLAVQTDGFTHILSYHSELVPQARWAIFVDEQFAGCAGYVCAANDHDLAFISIVLAPPYRGQGIGSQLYKLLVTDMQTHGVKCLMTEVFAHQKAGIAFVTQQDFSEVGRTTHYQLNIANSPVVDRKRFDMCDLRIVALDRFPQRGLGERLLPIWNVTRPDQPQHWPYVPFSVRQFEQEILQSDELALGHSFVIVTKTDQIIALQLNLSLGVDRLFTFYSAVAPNYRGYGLATTLKMKLIEHARALGFTWLSAENNCQNAAMRHINEKLGFEPQSTLITYQHSLAASS